MTKRIFITATNTDIGKTYTTSQLLHAYSEMGFRVGVFKPIETGVSDEPLDGALLQRAARAHNPTFVAELDTIVPLQFALPAAPYVANNAGAIDLKEIDRALAQIEEQCDIVLIEGAGGLMVPIDKNLMVIDLIRHFEATALLVSHCSLGCINDTLLSLQALYHAKLPHIWALNCKGDFNAFQQISEPYFIERFGSYFEVNRDIKKIAQTLLTCNDDTE